MSQQNRDQNTDASFPPLVPFRVTKSGDTTVVYIPMPIILLKRQPII